MAALETSFEDVSIKQFNKMKIVNALGELVNEAPFESVRVNEICFRAGVSRQTFYRHFGTKYEVVQWYWGYLAEKYLLRVGIDYNWFDSFRLNFEQSESRRNFFLATSKTSGHESILEYGRNQRMETLASTLENHCGIELTPKLEFQIRFFAYAESRVIGREVFAKHELDCCGLAEYLESCVPRDLHDLVEEGLTRNQIVT